MEPLFNEPLYNEVLDITNDFPGPSKSKIYGKELQYNESRHSEHILPVLYGSANDPRTANDPGPQMIPKLNRK